MLGSVPEDSELMSVGRGLRTVGFEVPLVVLMCSQYWELLPCPHQEALHLSLGALGAQEQKDPYFFMQERKGGYKGRGLRGRR